MNPFAQPRVPFFAQPREELVLRISRFVARTLSQPVELADEDAVYLAQALDQWLQSPPGTSLEACLRLKPRQGRSDQSPQRIAARLPAARAHESGPASTTSIAAKARAPA